MSLQNFVNTSRFQNQVQTDEATRSTIAQFFGDPDARSFVQDSGGVKNALATVDHGNEFAFNGSGMTYSPAPGVDPSTTMDFNPFVNRMTNPPTRFDNRAPMVASAPTMPSMIAPVGPSPTITRNVMPDALASAAAPTVRDPSKPFSSAAEQAQYQGNAPVPARPYDPYENLSPGKKALVMAFQGLSKFGSNLARQDNPAADEFFGRRMKLPAEQATYDRNLPIIQNKANQDRYEQYLEGLKGGLSAEHTQAEIDQLRNGMSPQAMQSRAHMLSVMEQAQREWASGAWMNNPEGFQRAVANKLALFPGIDPRLANAQMQDIMRMPISKYTVEYSKDGGVPTALRMGNRLIGPEQIAALNDPEAATLWRTSNEGYQRAKQDKEQQARLSQMFRGDVLANSKFVWVADPTTGIPRLMRSPDAVVATDPSQGGGYTMPGVAKTGKSRWAVYGDAHRAMNNLMTKLPTVPQGTMDAAKFKIAVSEAHGPIDTLVKAWTQGGMSKEQAELVAAYVSARDNIAAIPSLMGIPTTDPRVQALNNALAEPGDLTNPAVAQGKMDQINQLIQNLEEGLPGTPETFGVVRQPTVDPYNANVIKKYSASNDTTYISNDGGKTYKAVKGKQ